MDDGRVGGRRGSIDRPRLVLEWAPAIAWAGLIFWFSAQPDLKFSSEGSLDFVVRKAGHMFAFGVLALLFWRALTAAAFTRPWAWALVGAALYAASDEFHQSFTNGRHPAVTDVAIDCVGAIVALGLLAAVRAVNGSRSSRRTGA